MSYKQPITQEKYYLKNHKKAFFAMRFTFPRLPLLIAYVGLNN